MKAGKTMLGSAALAAFLALGVATPTYAQSNTGGAVQSTPAKKADDSDDRKTNEPRAGAPSGTVGAGSTMNQPAASPPAQNAPGSATSTPAKKADDSDDRKASEAPGQRR
jgi:hypothetical protein